MAEGGGAGAAAQGPRRRWARPWRRRGRAACGGARDLGGLGRAARADVPAARRLSPAPLIWVRSRAPAGDTGATQPRGAAAEACSLFSLLLLFAVFLKARGLAGGARGGMAQPASIPARCDARSPLCFPACSRVSFQQPATCSVRPCPGGSLRPQAVAPERLLKSVVVSPPCVLALNKR